MEFQLVMTENCNLACKYCYMDPFNSLMTKDVFDQHYKMLPKIMEFYKEKTYKTTFFGGEPLINWELIEYVVPILKGDPNCRFIMTVTNGLLFKDDYKRDYYKKNGLSFSLSFDGLWNKTNRPLKNGNSSLDEYLKEPLKSYFTNKGGSKVMVSPENISTMVENFVWLVEEYSMISPDFSLVRDDIWSKEDITLFEIEIVKLADVVINYFKSGKPAMAGFFKLYILDLIYSKSYGKRPFGCFAGCTGAAFMPDGKVYPCARFGSKKLFPIADSLTGKLLDNINILNNPMITNPQKYEKCLKCSLYNYCNAGCTFQQLNIEKLKCEPIDSICKLLHACYEQSIRITKELKTNKMFVDFIKKSIKNVG